VGGRRLAQIAASERRADRAMNPELKTLLWPASRLSEALSSLVMTSGLGTRNDQPETRNLDPEFHAQKLGLEALPVEVSYGDFKTRFRTFSPALLHVPGEDGFFAVLEHSALLSPGQRTVTVDPAIIRSALCSDIEAPALKQLQETLDRAEVPASKQARAREAILRERFSSTPIRGIWLLRLPPNANFWLQLRQVRVPQRLIILGAAHAIQYGLWILAWWIVGANVLSGRSGQHWLVLWALLLLSLVPIRVLITWLQGLIAIGAGARLKQRLFFGALRLDPDSIRHQGAGQLLGRVIESEAVEALALSGGFLGLVAIIELAVAVFVLGAGAGGLIHSFLLLAWLGVAGMLMWRYLSKNRSWTDVRLAMTHDLVESMVGHRTRLVQLLPEQWHVGEDQELEKYLTSSRAMDRSTTALIALVPRGWLVLGLIGLAPSFISGAGSSARIAIAVGGMLLAYRALKRLTAGAWQLAGAAVAWERVSMLYRAATRPQLLGSPGIEMPRHSSAVVDARNLIYRYDDRQEPVLRGCSLRINSGDRVVLEGPSGGGKSTLVSILAGLREPGSGELLVHGHDLPTLGSERWRRCIAAAPQFHENYVLTETFAFNLFMGRRGTPKNSDLEEAEIICKELGLGDLLGWMPAGMLQMVGESGWQLSHGERSRLYIARALLQDAQLVVLDESFAALDPENLQRAMECVVKRAKSLLVIAHR
jgi:ATP-binding cassette subfamily B protein